MYLLPLREWCSWLLKPVFLILTIMSISSIVFFLNYGGNPFYSFLSARELLLMLGGPGVYLLYRSGVPVLKIESVVYCALLALMINYLFFYFTMDLKAAFFSSDHTVSNLVTYDDWRGFRLKPSLFAIMVALLAALVKVFQRGRFKLRIVALLVLGLAGYIWSIVLFRSILATMFVSVLLYPLLLSSVKRVKYVVVIFPLFLIVMPVALQVGGEMFLGADGGSIRSKAFAMALERIPQHVIFGAGEDSAYGRTYQDIVAPYFYPDDIGWMGILYKYGAIGALLYLYLHMRVWHKLWSANISYKAIHNRHNPLIWGLFLWLTALSFNIFLNAGLAYAQGVTLGSLGYALASVHQHEKP